MTIAYIKEKNIFLMPVKYHFYLLIGATGFNGIGLPT
jgi:hypothetical protein